MESTAANGRTGGADAGKLFQCHAKADDWRDRDGADGRERHVRREPFRVGTRECLRTKLLHDLVGRAHVEGADDEFKHGCCLFL